MADELKRKQNREAQARWRERQRSSGPTLEVRILLRGNDRKRYLEARDRSMYTGTHAEFALKSLVHGSSMVANWGSGNKRKKAED